jgi:hypothetical protein
MRMCDRKFMMFHSDEIRRKPACGAFSMRLSPHAGHVIFGDFVAF